MSLTEHRGDSREVMLRYVRGIVRDIEENRGCALCKNKSLARALRMLARSSKVCLCPGGFVYTELARFEADVREAIAQVPAQTDCRDCLRLRRQGEARFGHDDVPPDVPCSLHALCRAHLPGGSVPN